MPPAYSSSASVSKQTSMSLFKKVFGSSQPQQPPPPAGGQSATTANAINQLREVVELLEKKRAHLESQIQKELIEAKVISECFTS
jgi:hypothetical protein